MKRMGLIQQKRPLYHQLIALLCIPPMGAGLVISPPLYHTLSLPSHSLACSLPLFLLYSLHLLYSSNSACQRFVHSFLVVPLFSLTYCTCRFFPFSIAQLKCRGPFQQFAGANLCLFCFALAGLQCEESVLFVLLLMSHLTARAGILMMTTNQNVLTSLSKHTSYVPSSVWFNKHSQPHREYTCVDVITSSTFLTIHLQF